MKSEIIREKMSLNSIKIIEQSYNTENMSLRFLEFINKSKKSISKNQFKF